MANDNQAGQADGLIQAGGKAGTVQPIYTKWCPKVYVIPETTLTEITHFNSQATVFFSVSSGVFSIALGIWIGAAFEETLNPIAAVLTLFAGPSLVVLSLIFFILGLHARRTRKSILDSIKDESKLVDSVE